jgi:hypothetical protein
MRSQRHGSGSPQSFGPTAEKTRQSSHPPLALPCVAENSAGPFFAVPCRYKRQTQGAGAPIALVTRWALTFPRHGLPSNQNARWCRSNGGPFSLAESPASPDTSGRNTHQLNHCTPRDHHQTAHGLQSATGAGCDPTARVSQPLGRQDTTAGRKTLVLSGATSRTTSLTHAISQAGSVPRYPTL